MALVSGSGSEEVRTLVGEVRLPRTLAGMLVGAALAWSGALMQAMTRTPRAALTSLSNFVQSRWRGVD